MKEYIKVADDYNIRYAGTYAGYRNPDGTIEPIKIDDARDYDVGDVRIRFRKWNNKAGWDKTETKVTDENLVLEYPNIGAINLSSGFVVLIGRMCRRAWKEMPHNDLSKIIDPFKNERKSINEFLSENYSEVDTIRLNSNVEGNGIGHRQFLLDLYNNKYYSADQAINLVRKGERLAAAMNNDWYVGITHNSDNPLLFKKEYAVGTVEGDAFVIGKPVGFLKEEISTLGQEVIIK